MLTMMTSLLGRMELEVGRGKEFFTLLSLGGNDFSVLKRKRYTSLYRQSKNYEKFIKEKISFAKSKSRVS